MRTGEDLKEGVTLSITFILTRFKQLDFGSRHSHFDHVYLLPYSTQCTFCKTYGPGERTNSHGECCIGIQYTNTLYHWTTGPTAKVRRAYKISGIFFPISIRLRELGESLQVVVCYNFFIDTWTFLLHLTSSVHR